MPLTLPLASATSISWPIMYGARYEGPPVVRRPLGPMAVTVRKPNDGSSLVPLLPREPLSMVRLPCGVFGPFTNTEPAPPMREPLLVVVVLNLVSHAPFEDASVYSTEIAPPPPGVVPGREPRASMTPSPVTRLAVIHTEPPAAPPPLA